MPEANDKDISSKENKKAKKQKINKPKVKKETVVLEKDSSEKEISNEVKKDANESSKKKNIKKPKKENIEIPNQQIKKEEKEAKNNKTVGKEAKIDNKDKNKLEKNKLDKNKNANSKLEKSETKTSKIEKNKNDKKEDGKNKTEENKKEKIESEKSKAKENNRNESEKNKTKKKESEEEKEEKTNKVSDKTNKDNLESNKNLIAAPEKSVIKQEEKPEYVKDMINKRRKIKFIFIFVILLILLIILFSTIFAILNMNNSNIINGVSIKNINVANLSKEDAINRLTEGMNKELIAEIKLKYGEEYSVSIKPEQIEFKYDINEAIENAYKFGREGNVLTDNYSIIYSKIFGKEIEINYTYNGELLNQFIEDINAKIPGVVVEPTYYIEENKLFVNKGIDGIQVKSDELKSEIIDAILQRNASQMDDGFIQTLEIPVENVKASEIDMEKIQAEIYQEPQDAYYETDPYQIFPDVDGVDLTISVEEAQNIVKQEEKEEYSFDLKITKADKTLDELGTEAFPYLISQFSTKYDASNRNRSTNLELAAKKINGKVLMPGDEFSFNKIVGKRTVEEGYKDAAIYADGGVVDGLAGGICQISTTLYNSVLLANLQITERRNHSFTTSYAPAGKDATVVWGTTDFRFINSRSYPIKIEATVKNGIAEFKIYGMQEETEYEVRILPVRIQSIPYATTYEEDPTVAPGQQIIKQAGHAGCKVTTYKELRLNGEVVSKEAISNDTYQPMRTIIRVAPGHVPVQ